MSGYDGPTLRAIRESMGVPLRRVARQVGMSHGHLSKVERGEHGRPITPAILSAYEKVTGVSLAEAAAALAEQRESVVGRRGRTWRPGQLTDMRRLAFNAAIGAIAIGGQIGEPLGRLLDTTGRPVPPIVPDQGDVEQLHHFGELFTQLDLRFGGAMTSQLAKTILRWAVPMVEPTSVYDRDAQPLYGALGALAARAAWAAFDTGGHEAARSLFRLALFCAVRSGDPHLRAHIMADAAAHHNHLGYHDDALDVIRVVEGDERVAAPVRMAIHGVKARAYAASGAVATCRRHLELAEHAFTETPPVAPAWVVSLRQSGHLHATTGHALAVLAEHTGAAADRQEAIRRLAQAVADFNPDSHARAVALCQAKLSELHLQAGELEPGEWWGRQALAGLDQVRSARLARSVGSVRRAAGDYPEETRMAQLTSEIDAALITAEQPYGG
ncbi:helix-turn-helix transcriptional regulator [Natronosporangium hydrolyticum]|uniref:Helix-turn-helix transcriptional regulator n=1 Tax=Natronosporangium hydrolyticum TaxID=2811111 RepID=A0A895YL97_9ACTN|nr:helix-turn-helix transcriptional regulator [Natronosporangium hydrolyticum]QSB16269.1 helix-turn-helix transcriptional regulator [Natronosporangium hydrolyticum]